MPLGPEDLPAEKFARLLHGVKPESDDVVHRFSALSRFRNSDGAAEVYERMSQPQELLWIITALGEDPAVIEQLRSTTEGVTGAAASQIIREMVPWLRAWELFGDRRIEVIKTQPDAETDAEFVDVVRGMFGEFE